MQSTGREINSKRHVCVCVCVCDYIGNGKAIADAYEMVAN
jgi:hypothetical protein